MRFWVTSDLHYGRTKGDEATAQLAEHVRSHPADAFVLVGDLGNGREAIETCLQLFEDLPGPKLAVPGNHDVWTEGWPETDSWEIHERAFAQVLEAANFHPLHLRPIEIDGVGFVGSMGWYDYSFRDDLDVEMVSYETKVPPWSTRAIWMDAHYAHFADDDRTLTARLAARLREHLESLASADIVAAVHHLVDKSLLVHPRAVVPFKWRWANTFLGANVFGEVLTDDARVRSAFCGHIHMDRAQSVRGLPARCVGSDYRKKQLFLAEPGRVLEALTFS